MPANNSMTTKGPRGRWSSGRALSNSSQRVLKAPCFLGSWPCLLWSLAPHTLSVVRTMSQACSLPWGQRFASQPRLSLCFLHKSNLPILFAVMGEEPDGGGLGPGGPVARGVLGPGGPGGGGGGTLAVTCRARSTTREPLLSVQRLLCSLLTAKRAWPHAVLVLLALGLRVNSMACARSSSSVDTM